MKGGIATGGSRCLCHAVLLLFSTSSISAISIDIERVDEISTLIARLG
jgi:hypothetical protein